jgi:hypothetical protein
MENKTLITRIMDNVIPGRAESKKTPTYNPHNYPIEELASHVGEQLEFHYLNQDIAKIEIATLLTKPTEEMMYIGSNDMHMHALMWMTRSATSKKQDSIRLIKDLEGKVLYENPEIPFENPSTVGY